MRAANSAMTDSIPRSIQDIVNSIGLGPRDVEPMGWFKGKFALNILHSLSERPVGEYINVTGINPTPLGEGKTVVAIGLAMALERLGHRSIATLREPSLAPVFGSKGGGAGGGAACLLPQDDIDLHFTGDMHAVAAANNLLAAMIDNHANRQLSPQIDPRTITWRRCVDVSDNGLNHVITGLDHRPQAPLRETGFDITAASEVMAILSLSLSLTDLQQRLGRTVVACDFDRQPVTAADIKADGAMTALLRDAIRPNLVQTCEHTPAIVHTGPFANIAHGNSSVMADLIALRLSDYVVTESGFGSDCGAEKFFHIKCRANGLKPCVEVLVCSVRAIKLQSGRFSVAPGRPLDSALLLEDFSALESGVANLAAHLDSLRRFGPPVVVAINRFPSDSDHEIERLRQLAISAGAEDAVVVNAFSQGSAGATELAEAVIAASNRPSELRYLYAEDASLIEKIATVATHVYGAAGIELSPRAKRQLNSLTEWGFGGLPVCIAKTPYSLSHDAKKLGRPVGFELPVTDARLAAGAGFVNVIAGDVNTMPGLSSEPNATRINVDDSGKMTGLC